MVTLKNKINTWLMKLINRIQYPVLYQLYKKKYIPVYGCFERIVLGSKKSNLGDDLNIEMMELLTKRKILKADYNIYNTQNYSFIGSILENVCRKSDAVYVWGSGFKYPHNDISSHDIAKNKYFAVRGPKTREIVLKSGGICPEIYGDPVLLINKVYNPKIKKVYKIGIIPHIHDYSLVVSKFSNEPDSVIIDIKKYKNWKEVINLILSCQYIISSSLHGIIIADAYSIPNIWARFSGFIDGDGFKYEDYFLGANKKGVCVDLSDIIDYNKVFASLNDWEKPSINAEFVKSCPVPLFL